MSHMLPDVSAPPLQATLGLSAPVGARIRLLAPVVCAAAQTDGRRAQILFSSRWIMAVGTIAISPDALSTNAYALRMNARSDIFQWFVPQIVVVHPHASFTDYDDLINRNINWRRR